MGNTSTLMPSRIIRVAAEDMGEIQETVNVEPQNEVEVVKPVIEPTAQPLTPPKVEPKTNQFYDTYLYLCGLDLVPKVETIVIGDKEMPIAEFLTSNENLTQLVSYHKQEKEASVTKDVIDLEDLDPFTVNIVKAIVNGGNLQDILNNYSNVQDFTSKVDLDTVEGQQMVIAAFYQSKGLDSEAIMAMIAGYTNQGRLATEAIKCHSAIEEDSKRKVEEEAKKAEQTKKSQIEQHNTFKTNVRNELRNVGCSDTKARTIAEKYLKVVSPNYYHVDSVYEDRLKDPKYAADLILFLDDKEAYVKSKLADELNRSKLEVAQEITKNGKPNSSITLGKPTPLTPRPKQEQQQPTIETTPEKKPGVIVINPQQLGL